MFFCDDRVGVDDIIIFARVNLEIVKQRPAIAKLVFSQFIGNGGSIQGHRPDITMKFAEVFPAANPDALQPIVVIEKQGVVGRIRSFFRQLAEDVSAVDDSIPGKIYTGNR